MKRVCYLVFGVMIPVLARTTAWGVRKLGYEPTYDVAEMRAMGREARRAGSTGDENRLDEIAKRGFGKGVSN